MAITRLQELCPVCLASGKNTVAKEKFSFVAPDRNGDLIKVITLECFHVIKKIVPKATPYENMVSNDWKPEVKSCFHKWNKNQCELCGEFKLFKFQVIGATFAEAGLELHKGAGIFDDMGLGKTVQALAVLKYHHAKYCPAMIVTKSAIKFQWFKQIVRWLGPDFGAQIISTSKDFLFPNLKTYIIPYDLLRRFNDKQREKLYELGIKLVILDECQQIKNDTSTRTVEVRKLVSNSPNCKVLPLSATPWKNRGNEFYPALNLMDPIKFYSPQAYVDRWVEYFFDGNGWKMGGIRKPKEFREFTETMIIRREYDEVMEEFPSVNRMKMPVQLDEMEQSIYDDSVGDFVKWYNEHVISGDEDSLGSIELLAKMARLRHITGLAKIPATLGFIEEFIEDTEKKIVVFVHHKDVGTLMQSALTDTNKETNPDWYHLAQEMKEQKIKVFKYGSDLTGTIEGSNLQDEFNNTKRCVLIASTLACGEGIDLQTCADCILHERQWNPQNEDQAAPGRFKRIGQTSNQINITLPEAEGTIDEQLDFIVEDKRGRYHVVMNKTERPTWNESEFARSLAQLIVKKHNEKFKGRPTVNKRTKEQFAEMVAY